MRKDSEDELVAARAAARERVLREFESAQTAIGAKKAAGGSAASSLAVDKNAPGGLKRKFELDEDEVDRLAEAETEKALSKITSEAFESRKAKLPNFWLVSVWFFDWDSSLTIGFPLIAFTDAVCYTRVCP